MPRKKVKLQWIANDATNRATFKKRRMGLMKKVKELSILCNVKACALVYGPYEPQPEVWPSVEEAADLLRSFRGMPEHEQGRRRMDQESFLRQWAQKLRDQIEKEKKAATKTQVELLMMECLGGARKVEDLSVGEITGLGCLVESKLKEVQGRIELLRGQDKRPAMAPSTVAPAPTMEASPKQMLLPLPPMSPSPSGPSPPPVRLQFTGSSYSSPLPTLQPPPPSSAPPPPPPSNYPSVEVAGSGPEMSNLQYCPATPTRSKQQTTDHVSGLQAAAAATAQEGARSRPDQLMEMMGLCGGLLYEDQDGMPQTSVDDHVKNSWMDPYLPFD
ncbi:hypothetical protein Taro_035869 [Colocasia esculenta]|uniref:MADS-box domain-containing protein n=1 Tax=Colocasia esculenta TaxID=4460 RepID=A0A843VVR8_COLES|nr:hypothetical protein [Colocasia esculenta]